MPGVEPLLLVAVFAASGPFFVLAPLPTAIAGLLVGACYARGVTKLAVCFALATAALGTWRATQRVSAYIHARDDASSLLRPPARCAVVAEVLDSPTVREATTRLRLRVETGECEGRAIVKPFIARVYGGPAQLRRGDVVEANLQLGLVRLFRNADLVDPVPFAARSQVVASGSVLSLSLLARHHGIPAFIDGARNWVRFRIEQTFAGPAIGLAKALVLGENDLSEEEDHSFKVSGLAHLLAVSGTHLIFAVVSMVMAGKLVLVRIERLAAPRDAARYAYAAGALLAAGYADFAGGSGSAWRAAWMLSTGFILRALGREAGAAQCVAASIGVGLVVDPLVALDLSFLLSLAATAGLMTLGRSWARHADRLSHRGARLLVASMVATVASTIPCSLVMTALSTEVSLLGVVANTLAAPFGELVALPLCLVHSISSWCEPIERGLALVASGALLVVRQVALLSAQAEGYGVPLPYLDRWQYAALFVLLAAVRARQMSVARSRRFWLAACGVLAAVGVFAEEWSLRRLGAPLGQLRVTFLDVGQGDSTLVDLPDGSLVLIDGGGFVGVPVDPGKSVILPVLRARRRSSLDAMVLSHPHPDHFAGLTSVLSKIDVREFWDTGQGRSEGAGPDYAALLDVVEARQIEVKGPRELCGARSFGGAELQVFGPCPSFTPGGPANDNSFVVRFAHAGRSILLVGDAEAEQERALVEKHGAALASTVLKVGHHGSRTSSGSAFLAAVRPRLAVVSCGVRNRFGHPHAEALERLESQGILVWRIDSQGSAVWAN